MAIEDNLAPKKPISRPPVSKLPANSLEGTYIFSKNVGDTGGFSVMKERYDAPGEYTVVIPSAGYKRDFVVALVDMLNGQGTEAPQS